MWEDFMDWIREEICKGVLCTHPEIILAIFLLIVVLLLLLAAK